MKNFQVIHGQCDSILFPKTFSHGRSIRPSLTDKRILLIGHGIFPQILELHGLLCLFVVRLIGVRFSEFHKMRDFFHLL